jgi:hypothetical protein
MSDLLAEVGCRIKRGLTPDGDLSDFFLIFPSYSQLSSTIQTELALSNAKSIRHLPV